MPSPQSRPHAVALHTSEKIDDYCVTSGTHGGFWSAGSVADSGSDGDVGMTGSTALADCQKTGMW